MACCKNEKRYKGDYTETFVDSSLRLLIIVDILEDKYKNLDVEEREALYESFKDPHTQAQTLQTLEKIIFKRRPPTGEEFLDPDEGWLPKNIIDSIYPHVREDFLNIVNDKKYYFQVVLYGGTRLGKTFLARLLIIYTIIFIHHLREPSLFFNLSPTTNLCIYFISFKIEKTKQLYLQPMFRILERSKRFIQVKFQEDVVKEQQKHGCDKIVYSKAAMVGQITLASGLQILLGNDNPNDIIGADIIQCYISEIAFFIEEGGATEEGIYQLYTDALDRIKATVGEEYLSYVYLDTSANYADALIEEKIIKELSVDPEVYFRWRSRWEARPHMFPKWERAVNKLKEQNTPEEQWNKILLDQKKVFRVITGNGDIPAKLVTSELDLINIPEDLVDYVPIDAERQYKDNLIKEIKDIGGKPSSNESKFVQNRKLIDTLFSLPYLMNIEGGIEADASENPDMLLFNKIKSYLFTDNKVGQSLIRRAPREPRFVAFDTAHSVLGDIYGICISHPEFSRQLNCVMNIVDLCFCILPGPNGINLSAPESMIYNLRYNGLNIISVTVDSFQSKQMEQNLKREKIDAKTLSVDTSLAPYMDLLSGLNAGTVKSGKNIFLKNNLGCLVRVRDKNSGYEKIDHPKGPRHNQYYGDYEHSKCGTNAKDCSDTLAATTHVIFSTGIMPSTIYEDENRRMSGDVEYQNNLINLAYKKISRAM